MLTKKMVCQTMLSHHQQPIQKSIAKQFAPTNIALCKYWGKRNQELNLPYNSSLSIALTNKGAYAEISQHEQAQNCFVINGQTIAENTKHYQQLNDFIKLLCEHSTFLIKLTLNIPIAAGLASSAAIFAALTRAFDQLCDWQLSPTQLSLIARLGSGSACRSIYSGFVEWEMGQRDDGMDSFAKPITMHWPELRIGLCVVDNQPKSVSSRHGMLRTTLTSPFYQHWPTLAHQQLAALKTAIEEHNFPALGQIAEQNALAMHATMLTAWPPLVYSGSNTISLMQRIWALRDQGLLIFFTQDAGPNLKLLFLADQADDIAREFSNCEVITPFP